MDIYPEDTGFNQYMSIMFRRLNPTNQNTAASSRTRTRNQKKKREISERSKRFWASSLDIPESKAEKAELTLGNTTNMMVTHIVGIIFGFYMMIPAITLLFGRLPILGAFFLLLAVFTFGLGFWSRKYTLKQARNKAISPQELEALIPSARGDLSKRYLELLQDVNNTEISSVDAQEDIRTALRAIGSSVDILPSEAIPPISAGEMMRRAQTLRTQAATEPDVVVRESLMRQAKTLEEQLGSIKETEKAAHRSHMLRTEVEMQMESLRRALLTFQNSAVETHNTGAITASLSSAMQQIAQESEAIALARQELAEQELADLLGQGNAAGSSAGAAPVAQPVAQPAPTASLLQPQNPPPAPPQTQQVGQGKPWWQNNNP